jgi:hypothetical protein
VDEKIFKPHSAISVSLRSSGGPVCKSIEWLARLLFHHRVAAETRATHSFFVEAAPVNQSYDIAAARFTTPMLPKKIN